jgi:hypothetical protein
VSSKIFQAPLLGEFVTLAERKTTSSGVRRGTGGFGPLSSACESAKVAVTPSFTYGFPEKRTNTPITIPQYSAGSVAHTEGLSYSVCGLYLSIV